MSAATMPVVPPVANSFFTWKRQMAPAGNFIVVMLPSKNCIFSVQAVPTWKASGLLLMNFTSSKTDPEVMVGLVAPSVIEVVAPFSQLPYLVSRNMCYLLRGTLHPKGQDMNPSPQNTSPAAYDRIIYLLSPDDIRRLKIIVRAGNSAVCILPPLPALLQQELVMPYVDQTARPIPRSGWRPTQLGMAVYDRVISNEQAATRWVLSSTAASSPSRATGRTRTHCIAACGASQSQLGACCTAGPPE